MTYCTSCGKELFATWKFCSNCGIKITDKQFVTTRTINPNKIYRLEEASDIVGLSISSLRRRISAGYLKRVSYPGEDIRILGSEILKLTTNK